MTEESPKSTSNTVTISELNYSHIFENMSEMFQMIELIYEDDTVVDYYYRQVNPAFEKLVGMSNNQIIGKRRKELFGVVDNHWLEVYKEIDKTDKTISAENDGKEFDTQFNKQYEGKGWKVDSHVVAVIFSDITERKRTEAALVKSEDLLSKTAKLSKTGGWTLDLESGVATWTEETYHIFEVNLNREAPRLPEGIEFYTPKSKQIISDAVDLAKRTGTPYDLQLEIITANNNHRWVHTIGEVNRKNGKIVSISGIIQDITERKQAEKALIQSEERFRKMFQKHNAIMLIIEPKTGQIIDANNAAANFYGYSKVDLKSMLIGEINTLSTEKILVERENAFAENRNTFIFTHKLAGGTERLVEVHSSPIEYTGNKLLFSIIHDITDRKLAEEALQEMSLFPKLNPAPLMRFGSDGTIISSNPAAKRIIGNPASLGEKIHSVLPCFNEVDFSKCISGDTLIKVECQVKNRIYQFKILGISEFEIGHVYGSDITERVQAEEEKEIMNAELNKTHKLESIGLLAGGIAHDFNNLLGGMFGFVELAQMSLSDGDLDLVDVSLESALDIFDRTRGLTQKLLTFSKGGAPTLKTQEIEPLIRANIPDTLSASNCTIKCTYDPDLSQCDCDEKQIGQVINNLISNAQEAMPEGGNVIITAKNSTINTNDDYAGDTGHKTENYIKISIIDEGEGIAKDLLPKIYDPFYTTKTAGRGLGLTTVYSIIKRHNGRIEVTSELGKGSTFDIYLQALYVKESIHTSTQIETEESRGRVLIMDDEDFICEIQGRLLKKMGYEVTVSKDGDEAIALFSEAHASGNNFAFSILDLTIPNGMGGKEAILAIKQLDEQAIAFVVSGYADDPVMQNPSKYGFVDKISKPFRQAAFIEQVDRHLKVGK